MDADAAVAGAQASGRRFARHPGSRAVARCGYAAKGLVYVLVGFAAVRAATGSGGGEMDDGSRSAFVALMRQPFGRVLLVALALGLLAHALWRLVQALLDPENRGSGLKIVLLRVANGFSFVLHVGLAFAAGKLALGSGSSSSSGDTSSRDAKGWVATLLSQPFGKSLVALAGLSIVGFACFQLVRAARGRFLKELDVGGLGRRARGVLRGLGRAGVAARGVVFLIAGGFAVAAGVRTDPNDAKGFGESLRWIQTQPYGPWLLLGVALGLMAYGLFMFAEARWRRFR